MTTEHDNEDRKQESFTIAGGDSGWVFTPTQHPTPEEQYASEQKMFNEALVRNVIATIRENEDLRRELITILLDDVLNAIDWNADDIRVRLRAAMRIEE
jgi:hypothetical protein